MKHKALDSIAFIIQARLASQRAPRKMVRPFAGTSLTDIALEKIKRSRLIPWSQFYFAVHEMELVNTAEEHGANVFLRSKESMMSEGEPMSELYEWWDRLPYSYAVLISACTPLLRVETIDSFIRDYQETKAEGLLGVLERRTYLFASDGRPLSAAPPRSAVMNTKFVAPTYEAAHCLYAGRLSLIGEGVWMGSFLRAGEPKLFVVPAEEAIDIDTERDFSVAEQLYLEKHSESSGRAC